MSQHAPNDTGDLGQPEAPQEGRPVTFRTVDGSLPRIQALRLTPVTTRTLVERAREERTTVHGALCAARGRFLGFGHSLGTVENDGEGFLNCK